ncbi:bifunctional methylenetetrahydrofolate dehydrogenase/methenyltetrahydrofolate cyclohydrolase FolD [Pseudomonas aeruginosa]|uniref:bifunctional methylenetetrahydrofolate dehydrogenase/methenyltetrahydrofolate cyclohydrolase FolD n=1 Tax=Pseudomonas aeruginosa TaxID=287 RepID=UPI0021E18CBC|nr:bifunctional methylenetetrahydrofolate dehydrogenase/methenyltetrahydrofolate cyclohydrolase FolD [Pseudomonas aeruginosa]MCV0280520.1 bifunctional methylenetetrahydrofolate dehydrogenase/methenyltetrahydrofolate cyclohydrolase FolD [Pseudomonas aeruginosa]
MTAKIIDGKALAATLRVQFRQRVADLNENGIQPGLAVVLVGDNAASQVYVRNKINACQDCGLASYPQFLPTDTTERELLEVIDRLNQDDNIHGILVQLPLPKHIDMRRVLEAIAVDKDVDGFHLYNVGSLVVGNSIFPPCTPYGVQLLLDTTGLDVSGQNVVIVGASNIVGKPMALMLLQREATVTVCHVKTRDLAQHTILADILIVAAGVPNLIGAQLVKRGAVVIDVGINRLADGRIVGDVDFEAVKERASWITPVPGGVGPMTVTMLIENTLRSAERRIGIGPGIGKDGWDAAVQPVNAG